MRLAFVGLLPLLVGCNAFWDLEKTELGTVSTCLKTSFDGALPNFLTAYVDGSCGARIDPAMQQLRVDVDGACFAGVRTGERFPFTSRWVQVNVRPIVGIDSAWTYLSLNILTAEGVDTFTYVVIQVESSAGDNDLVVRGPAGEVGRVPFVAARDRTWRIEHVVATNAVVFTTLDDAGRSTKLGELAMPDIASVVIDIGAAAFDATAGTARFDNFESCSDE